MFENKIVGGVDPQGVHPGGREGRPGGASGPACWPAIPVVDIKVTLVDGSYHEVDSSEMAFKIAGSMAFKEALRKAGPVLLEPIMDVEVNTPEEYMGDVIGDLNGRRGQIEGMEPRGNAQVIRAQGAAVRDVRLCDGPALAHPGSRELHDAVQAHYEQVPKSIAEEIVSEDPGRDSIRQ